MVDILVEGGTVITMDPSRRFPSTLILISDVGLLLTPWDDLTTFFFLPGVIFNIRANLLSLEELVAPESILAIMVF